MPPGSPADGDGRAGGKDHYAAYLTNTDGSRPTRSSTSAPPSVS
jgi:hypothetical protein